MQILGMMVDGGGWWRRWRARLQGAAVKEEKKGGEAGREGLQQQQSRVFKANLVNSTHSGPGECNSTSLILH